MRSRPHESGPLLPGEASTVLTLVSGLIGLGGAFTLLSVGVVVASALFGGKSGLGGPAGIVALIIVTLFGVGYVITGIWLSQGRRRGAYLAFGVLALNILSVALGAARPSLLDLLLPVAAIVGLAFAWPYLSDAGHEVEEAVRVTPRPRGAFRPR